MCTLQVLFHILYILPRAVTAVRKKTLYLISGIGKILTDRVPDRRKAYTLV